LRFNISVRPMAVTGVLTRPSGVACRVTSLRRGRSFFGPRDQTARFAELI
jgi:hypothetical protein